MVIPNTGYEIFTTYLKVVFIHIATLSVTYYKKKTQTFR